MQVATSRERFDLLYEQLKGLHATSIDAVFKATAAFLIAAGWVVTSDSARAFLASDSMVRWISVAALALYSAVFSIAGFSTCRRSQFIGGLLKEEAYMPADFYRDLIIHTWQAVMHVVMNVALTGALACFIVLRRPG